MVVPGPPTFPPGGDWPSMRRVRAPEHRSVAVTASLKWFQLARAAQPRLGEGPTGVPFGNFLFVHSSLRESFVDNLLGSLNPFLGSFEKQLACFHSL